MRKLIATIDPGAARTVKVYWDTRLEEFVCRLYVDGLLYAPADYFTNDHGDAMDTARAVVAEPGMAGSTLNEPYS